MEEGLNGRGVIHPTPEGLGFFASKDKALKERKYDSR